MPERVKHLFEKVYKGAGAGTESNVDRTRYSAANQYSRTDINQSKLTDEASDKSGASFITFSDDYVVVRNYMKESAAGKKTDPPVKMSLCCRRRTARQSATGLLQGQHGNKEAGNLKELYHGFYIIEIGRLVRSRGFAGRTS